MRIGICDDETDALDMLQSQLEEVGRANQIERFSSACSLRNAIDSSKYFDLIFMDIELSELQNGIDFASSVNETCPDIQIVFVTGHPDRYYQQIFLKQVNLCGYLEKPVDRNVLKKLLQKALEIIRKRESQTLLIQQNGTVNAIPNSKIQYIESSGHQLIVHTADEIFICYERLEKLKDRLPESFLQCHKSYLVNMDFIRRVKKTASF